MATAEGQEILQLIITSIVGTGLLTTIINIISNAIQNRKNRLKNVEDQLNKVEETLADIQEKQKISEKDALRTQLLLMISDYPDETMDILKLAEYYFSNLHGNWTATFVFNHWLEKRGIAKPSWFHFREEE